MTVIVMRPDQRETDKVGIGDIWGGESNEYPQDMFFFSWRT